MSLYLGEIPLFHFCLPIAHDHAVKFQKLLRADAYLKSRIILVLNWARIVHLNGAFIEKLSTVLHHVTKVKKSYGKS